MQMDRYLGSAIQPSHLLFTTILQEIWISQRERNMDGCDISNQLTGGFLPNPPPPQQLKETHTSVL